MLTKSLTKTSIHKAKLISKCCPLKCFGKVECINIAKCRYNYWNMKSLNRLQWLYDQFAQAHVGDGKYMFTLPGKKQAITVCNKLFMKAYNINRSTYYRSLQKHKDGCIAQGFTHRRKKTAEHNNVVEWLEDYATYHGDRMPHIPDVFLPYGTRKGILYNKYKHEADDLERKP